MARSLTFPANGQPRLFAAGDYGPYSIDSFSKVDADGVKVSFLQTGWPQNVEIAEVTIRVGSVQWEPVRFGAGKRDGQTECYLIFPFGIVAAKDGDLMGGSATTVDQRDATASVRLFVPVMTLIKVDAVMVWKR